MTSLSLSDSDIPDLTGKVAIITGLYWHSILKFSKDLD